MTRQVLVRLLAVAGVVVLWQGAAPRVGAHGKEVRIALDSWTPQPDQPLVRLYEAHIRYATDEDPVVGARLSFEAMREEGDAELPLNEVAFSALADSPGAYVAQVHYPRFGRWDVTLRTEVPGVGEASTVELISPAPPAPGLSPNSATQLAARQITLQLQFDWHDVLNIAIRVAHAVGGVGYLGLAGVLLANLAFGRYLQPSPAWRRLVASAVPLALACLVLIVASGAYTGYFDGPIRAPGAFDLQTMGRVPFGEAYVITFWAKALLALGVLVVIARARSNAALVSTTNVLRLTAAYSALVVLLLGAVAVLVYLHALSHLSGYLASG